MKNYSQYPLLYFPWFQLAAKQVAIRIILGFNLQFQTEKVMQQI